VEPRIQYATTKDGVSIANWTLGEGMPLIHMPTIPWSHIQLEWQAPGWRRWYERLARGRMVVRYDGRGCGLSDRDVCDYSLEAWLLDLEAVIERLSLERFALLAGSLAGLTAIACAARYPQRVSHLLLWCSYARGADFWGSPRTQAFRAIRETDWDLFLEAMVELGLGQWVSDEEARAGVAFLRESVTPEAANAAMRAVEGIDVTELLPQVTSPTLVLHRRQLPWAEVGLARGLASKIPDARLVVLEGTSVMLHQGDTESVLTAIDEFLGEGERAASKAGPVQASTFRTVLFTDVEGSTALTQRLGDAKARDLLREHERMVREALKSHGGSELKTMGDGFMASFSSATRALESAIAMQRAFAVHNQSAQEPMLVRVGLNAGEPIAEDEDLFGTAVIAAARIAAQARGGEILASDVVRQLVAGKQFRFSSRGRTALKGFDEAVEVYEVAWQEE
jgi:class 3 adenylate cyclase